MLISYGTHLRPGCRSQWRGKVKQASAGKVGKSYQLIYHSPKIDKSKEDEYTVASETGYEYSTVKEVLS